MLSMVCHDVQVGHALQEITGKMLARETNRALDARLDVDARGLYERQGSAFFDVRVRHTNAEYYKDVTLKQICLQHENENKRMRAGC